MQVLDSLIDGPLRLRNRREGDELIGMIVRYLRTGEEPEPRTDAQEAVLCAVRPVMETSRKRILAGCAGGKAASNEEGKSASKTGSKTPSKRRSKTASKAASNEEGKPASKQTSEEEEEEEEELGRGIEERGKAARFRAPSPSDVAEYAEQFADNKGIDLTSLDFDPERFVDFYAQKGWMVGRTRMKDWQATVRNWVRSSKPRSGSVKEVSDDGFSAYD